MTEYEIRDENPPIYDRAKETFPLKGGEIFAWDGIIYAPGCGRIPPWLIDHEKTHFKQQDGDPEGWWERYFVDPEWRYQQELEAHQVEYRSYCKHNRDRNKQYRYLRMIAKRLTSPMYGGVGTFGQAMKSIARR